MTKVKRCVIEQQRLGVLIGFILNYGVLPQGGDVTLVRNPIFRALFRHVGNDQPASVPNSVTPAHDLYNAGPDLLLTDAPRHTAYRKIEISR